MVRRCWVNFLCRGVLLIWITVGQGPIVLAVGAGGGCLDIFSLIYPLSPLSPSLWETARYRLKYCLKGPLNPKQPTNHLLFVFISRFFICCFFSFLPSSSGAFVNPSFFICWFCFTLLSSSVCFIKFFLIHLFLLFNSAFFVCCFYLVLPFSSVVFVLFFLFHLLRFLTLFFICYIC